MSSSGVKQIPESKCLECGYKVNASGSMDGSPELPGPGDLVLCLKCGAVMLHAEDMRLRGMTDKEMDELTADQETMNELAKCVKLVHILRHSLS